MIRLRQIALVATDLDTSAAELGDALGASVCFRDPGVATFGLHNVLFAVGQRFVEIVSPTEEGTTAGRLLERRSGDGGYMVIFQVDDLGPVRERAAEMDVRLVYTADGKGVTGLHFHPRDLGGAIVSVDQTDNWAAWPWAGTEWMESSSGAAFDDLVGVEIQAADPDGLAERWSAFLDRPVVDGVITLDDGGTVRFVSDDDDRGDGVSGISVRAVDRSRAGSKLRVVGVDMKVL